MLTLSASNPRTIGQPALTAALERCATVSGRHGRQRVAARRATAWDSIAGRRGSHAAGAPRQIELLNSAGLVRV